MRDYLAPSLYLPVGSLCDCPGVFFEIPGFENTADSRVHFKTSLCSVYYSHEWFSCALA